MAESPVEQLTFRLQLMIVFCSVSLPLGSLPACCHLGESEHAQPRNRGYKNLN